MGRTCFLHAKIPQSKPIIWCGILQQKQQGAHLSHSFHGNPMGMRTVLVWQPDSLTMSHLETLLKFSTILGATDQRTHIQGNDTAILDGYPPLPITRMLTAKWVGRIFWDDSEKGALQHMLELIFEQTNPTFRASGTSLVTTRWARPSTMAVLPTPGSPTSVALVTGMIWDYRAALGVPWNKNQSNRYIYIYIRIKTHRYQLLDTRCILLTSIFVMLYILFDYCIPSFHFSNHQPPTIFASKLDRGTRMGLFFVLRAKTLDSDESVGGGFGGWDPRVPLMIDSYPPWN